MGYDIKAIIGSCILKSSYSDEVVQKAMKQFKKVCAKAKAFDEILEVDNQATDEDRLTGEYESNIETIIGDYMEDK